MIFHGTFSYVICYRCKNNKNNLFSQVITHLGSFLLRLKGEDVRLNFQLSLVVKGDK